MDIQHIRYFLEVAKCQSFSGAARQLYVTQPILTRCVKNLEKELGVQLIDRSTRRFALTEAGRQLVSSGEALLRQHGDIYRQMEDMADGQKGEIRISGPGVLLDMYFPQLMAQYRREHPGIRITIRESGTRTVGREVLDGTADLGLVMLPLAREDQLEVIPMVRDEIHVLMHRDHPLAGEKQLHISQLKGLDIITYNDSTTLYHAFEAMCADHGFAPTIAYQSMMPRFILDTLSWGDCVGVLPAPMLQLFPRPELVSVPLHPHFPWQIAVIKQKDRYVSRAAESFLRFTEDFFTERE